MTRSLVVLFALCGTTLAAQQQPLVGTWQVSYAAATRMQNGEATAIMGKGVLTIEAVGDSLIGNLVTDPSPDLPARPPIRLAGKRSDGEVSFVSTSTATLNFNGSERKATAISTWALKAIGDSLDGIVSRRLEGVDLPPPPPQHMSGSRRNG